MTVANPRVFPMTFGLEKIEVNYFFIIVWGMMDHQKHSASREQVNVYLFESNKYFFELDIHLLGQNQ